VIHYKWLEILTSSPPRCQPNSTAAGTGSFDVVEIRNGKAIYDGTEGEGAPRWEEIAELAKNRGFEWGGDWEKTDRPHFQRLYGYSVEELRKMYYANDMIDGYLNVS